MTTPIHNFKYLVQRTKNSLAIFFIAAQNDYVHMQESQRHRLGVEETAWQKHFAHTNLASIIEVYSYQI